MGGARIYASHMGSSYEVDASLREQRLGEDFAGRDVAAHFDV